MWLTSSRVSPSVTLPDSAEVNSRFVPDGPFLNECVPLAGSGALTDGRGILEQSLVAQAAAPREHDHEDEPGGHAEVHARYRFQCLHPRHLTHLRVRLFEAFPATSRVEAQYASDRGQGAARLTAAAPVLRF